MTRAGMTVGDKTASVQVSPEVLALIERAQEHLKAYDGRRHGRTEALEWLLRDLCRHGSPVVGSWARKVWPDSVETREYHRVGPPMAQTILAENKRLRAGIVEIAEWDARSAQEHGSVGPHAYAWELLEGCESLCSTCAETVLTE